MRRRAFTTGLAALAAMLLARRPPAFARGRAEWSTLPDAAPLSSQFAPKGNWWGSVGPRAIIGAWNGWAWDEAGETAWLFGCGGHTDYGGNEVYRWRPGEGFRRLTDPDPLDGAVREGKGVPVDADGNPVARARSVHTYGGQVYVDGVVHRFGGSPAWPGGFLNSHWKLNVETLEHTDAGPVARASGKVPGAVWDPVAKRLIVHVHPDKGTIVDPATGPQQSFDVAAWSASMMYALDAEGRRLVHLALASKRWRLVVYDLDDQGVPVGHRVVPLDGFKNPKAGRTIAFDPAGQRFILWVDGVFAFDGSAVTAIEVARTVPSVEGRTGNGVYNRFSWAPSLGGFVTVIDPDEGGVLLRLS